MFHLRSITVVQIHEVFLPSISPYDERRRPRRDAPAADSSQGPVNLLYLKNLIAPPCPGEAVRRVTIMNSYVFIITLNSGCPQRDTPATDSFTRTGEFYTLLKTSCPAVPRRGPEAGNIINFNSFETWV